MNKNEVLLVLEKVLAMLETIETKGEKNLNALLASIQQVRKVHYAIKEGNQSENHDEQRKDA